MLKDFLHLWPAIKIVISLSESKAFKKNKTILLLKDSEILYLEKCFKIFNIFIKATTKLQADKYPTIYYLIPEVYNIYNRLETIREELNVSITL
jgi:predicted metal-dependent hydrolase